MNSATLSILVWGIYVTIIGLVLLFIPGKTLPIFGLKKSNGCWIRVVGIVSLSLGLFYLSSAHNEVYSFYWASIYARVVGFIGFSGLVITKVAERKIILFGLTDVLGAAWTLIALLNLE